MAIFNLLNEGFVYNIPVSGLRSVTAEEMDILLDTSQSHALTTTSGDVISLLLDLGFQHSVKQFKYRFTPLSITGLTVEYGRLSTELTSGALQQIGGNIVVAPTSSGYTYPRYFKVTHSPSSGTAVHDLVVENTEEEIDFGEDGTQTSETLVAPIAGGVSDPVEIPVFNSGTMTTDIYVSVDTTKTTRSTFDNLEIAPTITGEFKSVEESNVPNDIPWQWGIFDNMTVNDDNELALAVEEVTYTIGEDIGLGQDNIANNRNQLRAAVRPDNGSQVLITTDAYNRIVIIDPIKNTRILSSYPDTLPSNDDERRDQGLAWDGNDRVYYMNNSTDRTVRYYKISTNTHHVLTTITPYTRRFRFMSYADGYLYIGGTRSTAGTSSSTGDGFWKLNVNTLVETQLSNIPVTPDTSQSYMFHYNGYVYMFSAPNTDFFGRWNISLNSWEILSPFPSAFGRAISPNSDTNEIWVLTDLSSPYSIGIWAFNHTTGQWDDSPIYTEASPFFDAWEMGVAANGSYVYSRREGSYTHNSSVKILAEVVNPITTNGSWLSPVFLVKQGISTSGTIGEIGTVVSGFDSFNRVLIDRIENDNTFMFFDSNLTVENFQIRSSNTSPAGDNYTESFTNIDGIDTDLYFVNSTGGISMDQGSQGLEINHVGSTEVTGAFLYLNKEFTTGGEMQYRFWWKPPEQKSAGDSADRTSIFIDRYLDTLNTGLDTVRNPDKLRRNNSEYIRMYLGGENDTFVFTEIEVFKGGGSTPTSIDTFPISATSGRYYEVVLIINWDTGDYEVHFDGSNIGSGNIPLYARALLEPSHSVEIWSGSTGTGVTFTEYFRHFTISRLDLSARQDVAASPLHLNDPLYGINGSLDFRSLTVNSSILPVEDYLQLKLTFSAENSLDPAVIDRIAFPPVIRLPAVPPGQSKSVYVRYNFPPTNSGIQTQAYLKAYMATDKE